MKRHTRMLLITVLALIPMMVRGDCPPDQIVKAKTDYDLPVAGRENRISDCSRIFWRFEFHRTPKNTARTKINPNITGTDMNLKFDSYDFSEGDCVLKGSSRIFGLIVQPRIDILENSDRGHFTRMKLEVNYED